MSVAVSSHVAETLKRKEAGFTFRSSIGWNSFSKSPELRISVSIGLIWISKLFHLKVWMNSPFKLYVTHLFALGAVQLSGVVHKACSARRSYLFPQRESPRGDLSDADNVGDMPDSRQICVLFFPLPVISVP